MIHFCKYVYKVPEESAPIYEEPISSDFRVFSGEKEAKVYTARISAFPFNRVWPGFQRSVDQTELVSFVSIVADGNVPLSVQVLRDFHSPKVKPLSKNIETARDGDNVSFTLKEPGGYVFETEDGYHRCLYVFVAREIKAPNPDEVTYYFGPGVHFPGKMKLKSGESVFVDKDALVFGSVYAENAENIHVFGNGILDDSFEERFYGNCYAPFTNGNVKFYECKNLLLEGVMLRNSAIWCLNFFACENVVADGLKIFGQWRYNTDGVDIVNSRNITLKNSFIHSFDDTISIKGIHRYASRDNEHIFVENCTLWCDWGKTCEVGIETMCRRYNDITFKNIDILRAGNTALDIANGIVAEISDVTFDDIRIEFDGTDTLEVFQQTDDQKYERNEVVTPRIFMICNPRYKNYYVPGPDQSLTLENGLSIAGIKPMTVHDVTVKNVRVFADENVPLCKGQYGPLIQIVSSVPNVLHSNVTIENVTINGKKINPENCECNFSGIVVDTLHVSD